MNRLKIFPIRMPNPYFEKDNNAYLIDTGELILIDTGVDTPEAYQTLVAVFETNNYAIADLSKILLTHKHLDHFGLTHRLLETSSAQVYIHQDDLADVTKFEIRDQVVTKLYDAKLREWGVPHNIVDMIGMRALLIELGQSIPATALVDGEILNAGSYEVEVIHTPGHTQGSVCYRLGDLLFSGDHLLPTYTPNIGATDVTSSDMLQKYRESLLRIRTLNVSKVYPGHGDPFENFVERINEILAHHEEREEKILRILGNGSQLDIYTIAVELFGELKEHHVLLGAGEVEAHLELLSSRGHVSADAQHQYSLTR